MKRNEKVTVGWVVRCRRDGGPWQTWAACSDEAATLRARDDERRTARPGDEFKAVKITTTVVEEVVG